MIRRTLDAERINTLARYSRVRPWLGPPGEFDLTDLVGDPRNFALEGEAGAILFLKGGAGVYQAYAVPELRVNSEAARREGALAVEWMFTHTDAVELIAGCPKNNRAISRAAVGLGFTLKGETEEGPTFAISWSEWAAYHEPLIEAVMKCCRRNQSWKAISQFNAICDAVGSAPINLIAEAPLLLESSGIVVQLDDDGAVSVLKTPQGSSPACLSPQSLRLLEQLEAARPPSSAVH